MAIEQVPAHEPIAALHQSVIPVKLPTEEAIELPPVEVTPYVEDEATDLASLSSTALRAICTQRRIRWREGWEASEQA